MFFFLVKRFKATRANQKGKHIQNTSVVFYIAIIIKKVSC